jgi:hypothetical protein
LPAPAALTNRQCHRPTLHPPPQAVDRYSPRGCSALRARRRVAPGRPRAAKLKSGALVGRRRLRCRCPLPLPPWLDRQRADRSSRRSSTPSTVHGLRTEPASTAGVCGQGRGRTADLTIFSQWRATQRHDVGGPIGSLTWAFAGTAGSEGHEPNGLGAPFREQVVSIPGRPPGGPPLCRRWSAPAPAEA